MFEVSGEIIKIIMVRKITVNYHPILQIFQKLEISILIFKIYSHISLNQKNKTNQSACNNIKQKKS